MLTVPIMSIHQNKAPIKIPKYPKTTSMKVLSLVINSCCAKNAINKKMMSGLMNVRKKEDIMF